MEKNPQDLYARFLDVQRTYAGRNATFSALAAFFDGQHWDETVEANQEDMRLVLNYGRRAVLGTLHIQRNTALVWTCH